MKYEISIRIEPDNAPRGIILSEETNTIMELKELIDKMLIRIDEINKGVVK